MDRLFSNKRKNALWTMTVILTVRTGAGQGTQQICKAKLAV